MLVVDAPARGAPDSALARIHARRIGPSIDVCVSRLENGEWMIGQWMTLTDERIELQW